MKKEIDIGSAVPEILLIEPGESLKNWVFSSFFLFFTFFHILKPQKMSKYIDSRPIFYVKFKNTISFHVTPHQIRSDSCSWSWKDLFVTFLPSLRPSFTGVLSASVDRQYCHICYIVYINHSFFFLEMYKQFKDINLLVKEFSSKYLNGMSLTKNPSYIQTKPWNIELSMFVYTQILSEMRPMF